MMLTLALDASTYVGTVALLDGNRVLAHAEAQMRGRDAELLMPAVAETIARAGFSVADLRRVVCGGGPGSFTSLRIAASIAKGIAVGRGIDLFAVPSLALIVGAHVQGSGTGQRYLAVLDALRGESFVAEFEHLGLAVKTVGPATLVATADVPSYASRTAAIKVGPSQDLPWSPHARGVAVLEAELSSAGPVSIGSWEPFYGRLAEAQVKWEAAQGRALTR